MTPYKVLTVTQPWATLIALKEKRIETRSGKISWRNYRGPLLIHSSSRMPSECKMLANSEPFCDVLNKYLIKDLPLGAIICATSMEDCIASEDIREAWCYYSEALYEQYFGDYSDGRVGIMLGPVTRRFVHNNKLVSGGPLIAARGSLGLWTLPADVQSIIDNREAQHG